MTTLTYTFVSRCDGGCHVVFDVAVNGGAAQRVVYDIDDVRQPLANLTTEEKAQIALGVLKLVAVGRTRVQIANYIESNAGVITVNMGPA